METTGDGHEFYAEIEGETFHFTPDNTVLCIYENDLCDHILHDPEGDGQYIFLSRWSTEGLFDALQIREFRRIETTLPETYVMEQLSRMAVFYGEVIIKEAGGDED